MNYADALIRELKEPVKKEQDLRETDLLTILKTPRGIEQTEKAGIKILVEDVQQKFNSLEHMKVDSRFVKDVANKIVDSVYQRDENQIEYVKNMAKVREINPQPLLDNHCFFCPNPTYMETLFADLGVYKKDLHISTSENTLWKDRFIIPIRDFKGDVYGFVGYNKFSNAKYVEWSSPTYKLATIKALGLDHVSNILEKKYCIFTEGSFDYFRGHLHGFPVVANLGIQFNKLLKMLIDRLDIVFTAYDSDETGIKNMDSIDGLHPYVYHIQFKPTIDREGKSVKSDMDEALKDLKRVELLSEEIEKRLKFKNVKLPKRILV